MSEDVKIIIEGRADGVAQRLLELYMGADVGPSAFATAHMLDAGVSLPGITGNWDFGFRRFEPSPERDTVARKRRFAPSDKQGRERAHKAATRHKKQHRIKGAR